MSVGASSVLVLFARKLRLRGTSRLPEVTQQDENPASRPSSPPRARKRRASEEDPSVPRGEAPSEQPRQDHRRAPRAPRGCGELWLWRRIGFKPPPPRIICVTAGGSATHHVCFLLRKRGQLGRVMRSQWAGRVSCLTQGRQSPRSEPHQPPWDIEISVQRDRGKGPRSRALRYFHPP